VYGAAAGLLILAFVTSATVNIDSDCIVLLPENSCSQTGRLHFNWTIATNDQSVPSWATVDMQEMFRTTLAAARNGSLAQSFCTVQRVEGVSLDCHA
jgi:hypothetical protein